jgi:DNA-binding HxlR family transcriptional regulator
MLKSDYTGQNCPIARSLEAVGERWTLLIVRELLRRPHPLRRARAQARHRQERPHQPAVQARRPRDRREGPIHGRARLVRLPPSRPKGKDLFPVISALMAWGDRYEAPNGPPAILEHECGHPAGHKLVCALCGDDVAPRTVKVVAGPGATDETVLY